MLSRSGFDDNDDKIQKNVGFFEMFRFATRTDWLALLGGVLCCTIMGLGVPVNMVLYGEFTILMMERSVAPPDSSTPTHVLKYFGGGQVLVNPTPQMQHDALLDDSLAFAVSNVAFGLVLMVFGVVGIDLINYAALQQINTIRRLLLRSMLRQDMSWYDTNTSINFATKISEDVEKMKEGMGEKIGVFTYLVMSFLVSVFIAFIYGWKLTLVVMCSAPIIIIATAVVAKLQSTLTVRELQAYSTAGVVAEEVLSSIKTVVAFAGEEKERERYAERIKPARHVGNTKGLYSGLGTGIMWFIVYVSYAISFYYGVSLIVDDRGLPTDEKEYTPAVLVIVFFGVLAGAQNLGLTAPHIEAFNSARGAAVGVFAIVDRKSAIDSLSAEGDLLENEKGDIVFEDVHFHYPSRPDVKVLQGFNLVVHFGETVALVGPSGCGKSTCLQLLQRLYDPLQGRVTIAGRDIREINVASLRGAIGVVGQEPVLFGTSIYENIRYGRPDCTKEEIEEAARDSNSHDFIRKLQDGYNTMAGERGAQLSGGQKQRIAIARALVRQPSILLLDEATSALDTKSQTKVQMALEKTRSRRTTFIVSHRLSTIANADKIVVLDKGQVVEMGTHDELMDQKGFYYNMVNTHVEPETELKISKSVRFREMDSQHSLFSQSAVSLKGRPEEDYEEVEKEVEDDKAENVGFMRILKLNTPEWHFITLGCVASLVNGATLPFFAIVFGDIFAVLALEDGDEVMGETKVYCFYFLVIGTVAGLCMFVQMYMFSISGTRLTARLRVQTFSTMLRQEMCWFDDKKNSVGALSSRLAGECSAIQGATGIRVGSMLQAGSTMIIGMLIALYYSWKLALVSMSVLPIVLMAMVMEARFTYGVGTGEKILIESSSRIATEAISNIRTVASLCQEQDFERRYLEEMGKVYRSARRKSRMRGFVFSMGQMVPFLGYAVSLSYGGVMVAKKEIPFQDVIIVSEALLFGSWMVGQALAYAPNVNTAIVSARNLFKLFDREPLISSSPVCKPLQNWKAEGNIVYDKVVFTYPNRSDNTILRKLKLEVARGQTVALVGPSGSGKSTCIQLLQRLYDPDFGCILLDGLDIVRDIPLEVLRSQLGLVGQEPVLFDRTIAENIQYGDNSRTVSVEEVIDAATTANIHNFIVSLPTGYETRLGSKGTQLSGGQKQRIAIARALVRKPRVLLLDEATSALDAQSQKLVQEALDRASKDRTCIIIAHRLNTIRGADMIFVLAHGKVVERGTHEELMQADGLYRKLYIGEQQR